MHYLSFRRLSPILTVIGKYFKIDAHYFAKNTVIVFTGQAIGILRGVVTGYLVARLFQKSMYGEYQFISSMMGMLSLLALPGFSTAVARAWSRKEGFSLGRILSIQFVVSLIGSLILLGCIPFLGYYGRENLWPLFVAAAILFPLPPFATLRFGSFAMGQARFDLQLKANIIWSIIMVISVLTIIFVHQSALFILIANVSIPSLVYLAMSRKVQPPPDPGLKNTKEITHYGWMLTFASLPNNLSSYVDTLLISRYFGLDQLAVFAVAVLVPEQVKQLVKQLMPISFPRQAVMNDRAEARAKLRKVVMVSTCMFACGIALYMSVSWWILPILFPRYNPADIVPVSNASACILIFMPATLFYQYMEAQRMIKQLQWTQWVSAAVLCVTLVIFVPSYGLMGAIISRGIFRMTSVSMAWWFVERGSVYAPPPTA